MSLSFQFTSLSDFFLMSGHGPYVWAAYGITALGMIILVLQAQQRRKKVIKNIKALALRSSSANS